jgi:hypothetical protein
VFDLIPYGDIYEGMKIRASSKDMTFRFIDSAGKMSTQRFMAKGENLYQWVGDEYAK